MLTKCNMLQSTNQIYAFFPGQLGKLGKLATFACWKEFQKTPNGAKHQRKKRKTLTLMLTPLSVVDPGFPHRGAVYPRGGYISKILHVKTKESGPVGGCMPGVPPRSANVYAFQIVLVARECESPL